MINKNKILNFKTQGEFNFIDITDQILEFVNESQIKNGLVNVQSLHTTASLVVNENEPLLLEDIKKHLEKLVSKNIDYQHDNFEIRTVNMCFDECANGHAHCKAIHFPTSVTLNLIDSRLQLGLWQRIFFWELDRARARKVQINILGE